MNIVLFSPLPPPNGGIATWTLIFFKTSFFKNNDVYHINSAFVGKSVDDFRKFHFLSELRRTITIFWNIIKTPNKYKIVHYCCSCHKIGMLRDIINVLLFKIRSRKIILHCHCEIQDMISNDNLLFRFLVFLSNKVICITDKSLSYVSSFANNKATYIPNFAYLDQETKKKINIKKNIKKVVFVGHVTKEKGFLEFVELAKINPEIIFDVIGFCDCNYNVPSNINFLGNVDHEIVLSKMLEYDMLILPSHSEGFPNVILEAMSFGIPIIATKVGSIEKMLELQNDFLCKPNDVNDLIDKFNHAKEYSRRVSASNNNYIEIKKYFYNNVMSQYEKLYEECFL